LTDAARQKWSLTQEAFDGLLASLEPDRDIAADRYLEIRRNLVRLFEWRGCATPDEYADETINRCAKKIGEGEEIRDVGTYCIGIARMLLREMSATRQRGACFRQCWNPSLPAESAGDAEGRVECLRRCLGQLRRKSRPHPHLPGRKRDKIKNRNGLTQILGIPASTLRMRALRVRERLQLCAENCLQHQGANLL
jgi:DNA-directed RNA polymerase specialized sigma24 family protein